MIPRILRTTSVLLPIVALAACGAGGDLTGGSGGDATSVASGATSTGTGGRGPGGSGSGGTAGGAGTGGMGGMPADCSEVVDACPAPGGSVRWQCRDRFMYGINYAWDVFAGDFGGIGAWGHSGVSGSVATHQQNLAGMRAAGASTIRWWMFPDFRGDGVSFDGDDTPTGLGGTAVADIEKALELAEQEDVYLMLTLFSFDNFAPSESINGIWTPGITPMVQDQQKRSALLENVVRPVAQIVQASPYAHRVVAWDVINEPEWAISGSNPYGDPPYDTTGGLDPVTHAEMETFISETIDVLREESDALITVGGAAAKWSQAWTAVDVDFYQLHIYEWVNAYWPYDTPAAQYGLSKPIVMGEMPLGDLTDGVPYGTVVESFWDNGYAGAMGWQYVSASSAQLDDVAAFAAQHPCETHYSPAPTTAVEPRRAATGDVGVVVSRRRCRVVEGQGICD